MQDTIVKLTKKLVLHNKLYENLRGFTYTIHTNTHTNNGCNSVYGAEVGDCGRANMEAGGWQVIYSVSCTYTHRLIHVYAYTTWGQTHRARRLVTCQHSNGPSAAYLQKGGQVFVLGVNKVWAKQCPDRVQNERVQCMKKFRRRWRLPGEGK